MKRLNIIAVLDEKEENVLMCLRKKEPYKNKYNLVGGKVEENEEYLTAAYRELYEETGITNEDIRLLNIMNIEYSTQNYQLQVYAGKLNKTVDLVEELNELYWININTDFSLDSKFAGDGNLLHIMKEVMLNRKMIGG